MNTMGVSSLSKSFQFNYDYAELVWFLNTKEFNNKNIVNQQICQQLLLYSVPPFNACACPSLSLLYINYSDQQYNFRKRR